MKLNVTHNDQSPSVDLAIVTTWEDTPLTDTYPNSTIHQIISEVKNAAFFNSELGDTHLIYQPKGITATTLLILGLGKKSECQPDHLRHAAGIAGQYLRKHNSASLSWHVDDSLLSTLDPETLGHVLSEGIMMGNYRFDRFKTDDTAKNTELYYHFLLPTSDNISTFHDGANTGVIIANASTWCRDLANTPANILTPQAFVDDARQRLERRGLQCDIIDRNKAKNLGMNAFLGVAQGSVQDPYFLIAHYKGTTKPDDTLWLVGKGVTFDSGGISIKPSKGMKDMKADMTGAACVVSAMDAIAQLAPERSVSAIVGLVENMPSGYAQRPGDVVTAMNGKSIEIVNTDAEGRLVLADALSYVVQQNPAEIIDIATLTGAAVVALGHEAIAMLGNASDMTDKMTRISKFTGERVWQLPLFDDYLDLLTSDIADIAHASEKREAGTCSAAKFLEQFVDGNSWLHLDIAPVMSYSSSKGYKIKGMAGEGVRNLIAYALD